MIRCYSGQLSENSILTVTATVLITIFLLFALTGPLFADGTQTIYVSVDFEEDFEDDVRPSTLDAISYRLAEKFVTEANEKKAFLKWVNCESVSPDPASTNCATEPAWKIQIVLDIYEKVIDGEPKSRKSVRILHEGRLPKEWWTDDGFPVEPPPNNTEELHSVVLYKEPTKSVPLSTPVRLEEDIEIEFTPTSIQEILELPKVNTFLSLIPVAINVDIDITNELVIIPVNYLDLKSNDKSELTFWYLQPGNGGVGHMKLQLRNITNGEKVDTKLMKGLVLHVEHELLNGPPDDQKWDPRFVTIIPSVTKKRVVMMNYFPQLLGQGSHGASDDPDA